MSIRLKESGDLAKRTAGLLATWFRVGHIRWAPGTAGSIAALPFAFGFLWLGGFLLLLAATAIVFMIGIWAVRVHLENSEVHDPPTIVIDEVVGQWLTLLAAPFTPIAFLLGLLAFRMFDITKPWPIGWLDRYVPGALGVMIDDVAAALYAMVTLLLINWLTGL